MSIVFDCPVCRKTIKVKDSLAGKKGRCPFCSQIVVVPDQDDVLSGADESSRPLSPQDMSKAGTGVTQLDPKDVASKILSAVAEELSPFQFSDRHDRVTADIVGMVKEQGKRTYVFAVLDTLEFLRRSGRMNGIIARLGGWLQMKPLLKMHEGKPVVEKVLTGDAALARLIALVSDLGPLEKVAMVHTHALDRVDVLRQKAQHLLPQGDVLSMDITPVFGAHLGPGAVGFACVAARTP